MSEEIVNVDDKVESLSSNSTSTRTSPGKNAAEHYEDQRKALPSNPRGQTSSSLGINVANAEEEFAELSRELSNLSRTTSHISRTTSRRSRPATYHGENIDDGEKGARVEEDTDDEYFDLETVLRAGIKEEQETGIRAKKIGVLYENLTVSGLGGVRQYVKTFPQAFTDFINIYTTITGCMGRRGGKEFNILSDFRGVVRPGEMVLVLGRPGSGCTTYLKTIANQRQGFSKVEGEVRYGRFDAETFGKMYRGEAVYNQEDDNHHPTLSVGQTLGFALDTKTPGKMPGGISKSKFKEKVIDLLLKMFNIEHTRNTVVGNQFVRGISGGERKRVSIAEMMITKASVLCWDNTTRGLDASTALDYAKSLRIMTNLYQTTTFVSLYQASENIYAQFDKVLVIDSGRQVYFGPAATARSYFEGLGFASKVRMTTPDYLTGCTDEFEREYAEGRDPSNAPGSAEELEAAFRKSGQWNHLNIEIAAYRDQLVQMNADHEDFQVAVRDQKRKHTPKKSVYTIPFHAQIAALYKRQFLLKWQDKFNLTVSWVTQIVIALVVGSVFYKMPLTSAGAFTRGGALFISLLFNAFQAFSELASTMMGRNIVNKHKAFAFHRPSALWLAQIAVDMVFASARIMAYALIVYWMCGFAPLPGPFFAFFLLILTTYLGQTLFFRTIGCLSPDFDWAIKFAASVISLFILTSGYLIPHQIQHVWLSWVFWINTLGLGFSSMMMNEFRHIDILCGAGQLVPSGPTYTNLDNQACTLLGATPGSDIVSGSDYIRLTFDYDPTDQWRNYGIIVAIVTCFLAANVILGEVFEFGAGGKTVTPYAKENKETKALNEAAVTRRQLVRSKRNETHEAGDETVRLEILSKSVLTWENLCYDVPTPAGQLRLLNHIFGYVKPGQLTALMGASGAGKTTLLDVLAARKNVGVISGDVLVDGLPPNTGFQRATSYAEQLDVHEETQTVREALRFSAYLRQPHEVSIEEKNAYVEEVIALLEMENIADAIVGSPDTGLAVEERKRVTIGVELAAKPQLLLFLDEPTSGLDSQSAFNIVRFLRKLAASGQAILCTIHQPNSSLFENFDRLLLLQRGGQCVYFGDIGDDAQVLLAYLRRHGADCPPDQNPAEYMLDAIGAGQAGRIGEKDWGDIWLDSPEFRLVQQEIIQLRETRIEEAKAEPEDPSLLLEYASPFVYQMKTVIARTNLSFWRSPNYGFTRLFNHFIVAFITGLVFLQLDNSRSSLQYRVFIMFQVTVLPALIIAQVEPKYAMARLIYFREQSSKMYGSIPFAMGLVIAEMPYSILCAVVFFLPLYYMPGLQTETSRAGYQFLIILITELFSVTLGQCLAALTPNPMIAALLNPFIMITFALFCGVAVPKPSMPAFYHYWLSEINPFTYLVSGMVVTELHDRPVVCSDIEFSVFEPPSGQTCYEYARTFLETAPGYMNNPNASSSCQYCAYTTGDSFYAGLDFEFSHRWRDLGILTAFIGSNMIILYLAARYLNFARR